MQSDSNQGQCELKLRLIQCYNLLQVCPGPKLTGLQDKYYGRWQVNTETKTLIVLVKLLIESLEHF